MKGQHERMGNFEEAMVALGEGNIHSRTKEFRGYYGEMMKRAVKLAVDAGTVNL